MADVTYVPTAEGWLYVAGVLDRCMRRCGNGYDNVLRESLWSTLKCGLIHRAHFATRAQARAANFEWIEVFYNRSRFHHALGYQSPVDRKTPLN